MLLYTSSDVGSDDSQQIRVPFTKGDPHRMTRSRGNARLQDFEIDPTRKVKILVFFDEMVMRLGGPNTECTGMVDEMRIGNVRSS